MALLKDISKHFTMTLNYTRLELIEFGQSKAANEPPKLFDLIDADEKRKEKIRLVLKSDDIWKSLNLSEYFRHVRIEL